MNHWLEQFFQSYLVGYMLVFTLSAGALGVLLLHLMVGGEWGRTVRKPLRAMMAFLPWSALLFIPILLGSHAIYPWTHADHIESLGHKKLWLSLPFVAARAAIIFAFLIGLASRVRRLMDAERPDSPVNYYQKTASLGMVGYFLIMSMAAFDWMMSLEPHWASTIYGAMIIIGSGLSTFAFVIVALGYLQPVPPAIEVTEKASHDLGNLLFAFTILWTYVALSQYLIIWSANLPEEIPWYLIRNRGGWGVLSVLLVLAQFVLPFFLLLARRRKKNLNRLAKVAVYILAVRVLDIFWLIVPEFSPTFRIHMFDFLIPAGLLAVWALRFRAQFKQELAR